ncbi:(2,3-dihydroxybenzoyl)adenylate synthase [Amycolatopsis jejuensis]|uniref:(2,3-dihydroxybenzoyl)adenylate synthase n=1 Tax=Amycolatopsis jejuensis TaxID=330084 RepID=UPI000527B475|nr:AMP-binding protein [Amycolatopsis jejuensis]
MSASVELAAAYRKAGHWSDEPFGALLRRRAGEHPDRIAVVTPGERLSYRDFDARVDRFAAGLRSAGLSAGDFLVAQLPNGTDFMVTMFACFRAGIRIVFTLTAHRYDEVAMVVERTGAKAYVVPEVIAGFDHRQLAERITAEFPSVENVFVAGDPGPFAPLPSAEPDHADPHVDAADIALLLLSSGTTAVPKLVARTHNDFSYVARKTAEASGLTGHGVFLAALPAGHSFTLGAPGVIGTVAAGGTVVLQPDPGPQDSFDLIARERVTTTALTPSLAKAWLAAREWNTADLSSLEVLQCGGSGVDRRLVGDLLAAFGCHVQQNYGMSEGLVTLVPAGDAEENVLETQGLLLSAADEVRLAGAGGEQVAPGEVGELLARGPGVVHSYFRAPEHDERSFTPDGFYRTGDLVRFTESGHLVVAGRVKDLVNRGGEKVAAREVEQHLGEHPVVHQVAVVPAPHDALGECTCAYVVARGGRPTLRELRAFMRARGVAAYKLPDILELRDELPLTAVGKIDKKVLAAEAAERTVA